MKVKGLQIDIAIAEAGYRRAEFAKKCGILPQTLAKIVKDNSTTMYTAVKIANVLNVPVTDLIAEE
ncbi:MAG: helix-turn-helix transcriptional regulator [Clostridia bacterium]|nr:helix-turn-helix transcriptional regulator [Clostridia bacterium]